MPLPQSWRSYWMEGAYVRQNNRQGQNTQKSSHNLHLISAPKRNSKAKAFSQRYEVVESFECPCLQARYLSAINRPDHKNGRRCQNLNYRLHNSHLNHGMPPNSKRWIFPHTLTSAAEVPYFASSVNDKSLLLCLGSLHLQFSH